MLERYFGHADVKIPAIGQGTWMLEGNRGKNREEAVKALKLGLDLGMTHIDTAEMYGNGLVEEIVAEAIAGRREQVFLASKVLPSNASYKGVLKSCEHSLERLGTDWLDLYLIHWPSSEHPIGETMRAMERLVADGMVRLIGVSNFEVEELKNAEHALSKERLACNQVLYHLGNRGIERRLLPYCTGHGIALVGYSPFGHETFPSPQSVGGRVLAQIAQRHGRTPRQVALNFLTRDSNTFAIPKAGRTEHVRENSGATGWQLTRNDLEAIEHAFPLPRRDMPLDML